jgi:hypothetical protein
MRRIMLGAAMLLALMPAAALSAAALDGSEIQTRASGGEFRGYGATRRYHLEEVIWRFASDGTVKSASQILRKRAGMGGDQFEEYRDSGSWRVEGARLCVTFGAAHRDLSGCYSVERGAGDQVRLAGPVQLQGTLAR